MKKVTMLAGLIIAGAFVAGCRSQGNGVFAIANITLFPQQEKSVMTDTETATPQGIEMYSSLSNGVRSVKASGITLYQGNIQKANGNDEGNSPSLEVPITKGL